MTTETSTGLPAADVAVVRELAARVAELAALPVQQERIREWEALNDLHPERPMAMIDEVPWHELTGNVPGADELVVASHPPVHPGPRDAPPPRALPLEPPARGHGGRARTWTSGRSSGPPGLGPQDRRGHHRPGRRGPEPPLRGPAREPRGHREVPRPRAQPGRRAAPPRSRPGPTSASTDSSSVRMQGLARLRRQPAGVLASGTTSSSSAAPSPSCSTSWTAPSTSMRSPTA